MRKILLSLLAVSVCASSVWAQNIATVAGGGPNDVPAGSANVFPVGLTTRNGDLYIANGTLNRVYRINSLDVLTVIAGNGIADSSGDGGAATSAGVYDPRGIAVDAAGNLYIGESLGKVRRVDAASGAISTFAGSNSSGFGGDNGAATNALLRNASGLALDSLGNLYIADTANHRIRRVDAATGFITTFAGNGTATFAGDGLVATSASIRSPLKVMVDGSDNLYIADTANNRIRRVDAVTKIITTVAGNGTPGFTGDGGLATAATLRSPSDMTLDSAGNLYIADTTNNRVRRVEATTGIISTFVSGLSAPGSITFTGNMLIVGNTNAFKVKRMDLVVSCCTDIGNGFFAFSGENVAGFDAGLRFPNNLAFDAAGNLYVADSTNNRVRRIAQGTGIITTVAGNSVAGSTGDGALATLASLNNPMAVAVDVAGNLYIADQGNARIRRVDATTQNITTFAGTGVIGSTGDGALATLARLSPVTGVAVDGQGNVFVADRGNHRIRRIDGATGIITTFAGNGTTGFLGDNGPATAARLASPGDVAVDSNGNVFIADTSNFRIRRVDKTTNIITTVAGGGASAADGVLATTASIDASSVKVDAQGNLYIATNTRHKVRRVDVATQMISTLAGNGIFGFSGDGGPAVNATLANPTGVAVHTSGDLAVADSNNHRVRLVLRANTVPTITAGANASINEGTTFVQSGLFTDPDANSWTATVNYGDGFGPQALQLNANKSFELSHFYSDNGTYNVSVTVDDGVGGSATATVTVTVLNVAPVLNAYLNAATNEGSTFSGSGSFVDGGADTWVATVNYGDGSGVQPLTLNSNKSFNLSHVYSDNGTFQVTVSITDDDSGVGYTYIQVTVNNVAPVINSVTGPSGPVSMGSTVTVLANFTDAGSPDTHTCTFAWGDGQPSTTVVGNAGSCSSTHAFSAAGTFTVGVTVTDDDSGSASSSLSINVSVGSTGDFVTGGGWISSAGRGKANFGINAKYHKDATTPTGQTEFDFKAGDLNFHSKSYDWLAITGNSAQFQGSGTINGTGDFAFKVTAIDAGKGQPDKFRIVIWNKTTNAIVYDSGSQPLGGGSIVIHSK